jgi:putative FmdB family regulatory protein
MPLYEYRCRACDERFEVRRSMRDAAAAAPCPNGHDDTIRLLSMFATPGAASGRHPVAAGALSGGGCCGGACGCGH